MPFYMISGKQEASCFILHCEVTQRKYSLNMLFLRRRAWCFQNPDSICESYSVDNYLCHHNKLVLLSVPN